MLLNRSIFNLLPNFYSHSEQARATTAIVAALVSGLSVLIFVMYWVVTRSLESKKTIALAAGAILLLAGSAVLVIHGQLNTGIWILVAIISLMNFANFALYGIGTSASSGYVVLILLAMFCLGSGVGYAVALLGCAAVFATPVLQAKQWIRTIRTYEASNITFDAPSLTFVYLLAAVISDARLNWFA